jgi:predicted DNA-binding protein
MKRGRPKKDICKDKQYRIRITEEDMHRLRDFAKKHNVTMAFVVNEALKRFYEEEDR